MAGRLKCCVFIAALAAVAASCGDDSDSDDDALFLNKDFGGALDVTIFFPDGGIAEIDLPLDDFSTTRVDTTYVVGEVYRFSAQSPLPGIAPSGLIECTVSELMVCEGAAAVRVAVDPLANRVEISCRGGNWAEDGIPVSECSLL